MKTADSIRSIDDLERYLVGGAVRDRLLGIENYDRDWVVIGANPQIMESLNFKPIGKDFPVYIHPKNGEEYALARKETKSGRGYKAFAVDASSNVSLMEDLYRRDLTINAMAMEKKGTLIDPFGGEADLHNGLLRHVSEHFEEDPLRVLRAARLATKFCHFGFVIEKSTMELMKRMADSGELSDLTPQRVWQEAHRALALDKPSVFFSTLHECGALAHVMPQVDHVFAWSEEFGPREPIDLLDEAAVLTKDPVHRFCVVAHLAAETARYRLDSANFSADFETINSQAANEVDKMCRQLCVPGKFHHLSVNVARYLNTFRWLLTTEPSTVLDMMLAINGLRNPDQFRNFTAACEIVLKADCGTDNYPAAHGRLFEKCRLAALQVDAAGLSRQYSGAQLQAHIRESRIGAIRTVLSS